MKLRIAVVIGRFQVPELHAGHCHLISYARDRADRLLILIGTSQALPTPRNPLPYNVREQMLRSAYPSGSFYALADHPSDDAWSEQVDAIIAQQYGDSEVTLYGARDSFIPYYSGVHPIVVVPSIASPSGTQLRESGKKELPGSVDFRVGLIHAQYARLPISYQTVDIAVLRHADQMVLLGRKVTDGDLWRFIGGFVDPTDSSLEQAAVREMHEEAGRIDCHEIHYLGSYRVSDFRYRSEPDQVLTAFFAAYHLSGTPSAGDDIVEVAWHPVCKVVDTVVPSHRVLAERLLAFVDTNR